MRDVRATVVAVNKQVRVIRVDPHIVIIAMRHAQSFPGLAAVDRLHVSRCHAVKDIRIFRVDVQVGIVERPRSN